MDLTGLSNRRLAKRGTRIGRLIRIVNRDESVGAVDVRRIPEPDIPTSSFAGNIQQQRAQPTRSNARTGHCVRAFAPRQRSARRLVTPFARAPIRARSA
jgi:hypothetical protein